MPSLVSGSLAFAKITAGTGSTCGVATGGATYSWGATVIGQIGHGGKISYGNVFVAAPQPVVGGKSFQSVTLGNQFVCAVTTAGQGYCWGSNNSKLGNGPNGIDSSSPRVLVTGTGYWLLTQVIGYWHGLLIVRTPGMSLSTMSISGVLITCNQSQ